MSFLNGSLHTINVCYMGYCGCRFEGEVDDKFCLKCIMAVAMRLPSPAIRVLMQSQTMKKMPALHYLIMLQYVFRDPFKLINVIAHVG